MPFGFTEYRKKEGVSPSTLKSQSLVINQFFAFIDKRNKNKMYELNDLTANDVRQFLDHQKIEKKLTDFTVYRKQSNLKIFFDYLWRTKQILLDPLSKFNYFNETVSFTTKRASETFIMYDYRDILHYEKKVLSNEKIYFTSRLLMTFITKGIQLNDIFELTVDDFQEVNREGAVNIVANYMTKQGREATITFKDNLEVNLLKQAFELAKKRNTPYIISAYKSDLNKYGPSSAIGTRFYINAINTEIGINLRSEHIRIVYVHYLVQKMGMAIEEVAEMLGRSDKNVAQLLAEGIERIKINSYNEQMELVL